MLFSELYSVYYNTVAKIIQVASHSNITEKDLQNCIVEEAFSESIMTILPALKSGKWPLLHENLTPVLQHEPTMPLTLLEKRWLKAISEDPRIKLFGLKFPELQDIEPLFTQDDYKIYDQYADGDPFEDEQYIKHFQLILTAIKKNLPISITINNRQGKKRWFRLYPKGFEYSIKDNKIRILADGCKFKYFNLGRIIKCDYYNQVAQWKQEPEIEQCKDVCLLITDTYNALERAMLHFAHLEKRAERLEDGKYLLRLKYYENDETEILIRILSFGPYVKVVEPQSFVEMIKERLLSQKSCDLK